MNSGLEDVVAAETVLSDVDGAAGQLIIRGHSLAQLAGKWSVESVLHLLFDGFFDGLPSEAELAPRLGAARADVHARLAVWLPGLADLGPYDGLRAGIAMLPDGATLEDALRLVAAPAVLLPALVRLQRGEQNGQGRWLHTPLVEEFKRLRDLGEQTIGLCTYTTPFDVPHPHVG